MSCSSHCVDDDEIRSERFLYWILSLSTVLFVRQNFASRQEQGSAFAVYYCGELVVDLWGGYADYGALRYRKADSISMAYSSTKAVTAICMAMLVDRYFIMV